MKITVSPEEIIIRHIPVRELLTGGGLVFITGVFFLWTLYPLFSGASIGSKLLSGSGGQFIAVLIFGTVFSLMLYLFVRIPLITVVTLDQKAKTVNADFRRIYGTRTQRYLFSQIAYFKSHQGSIDARYRHLALVLANFKEVPLKVVVGKERWDAAKLVKKLNKFIKPQPPKQPKTPKTPKQPKTPKTPRAK